MRITVIGATGMVGGEVVAEALGRGHHVTAVSRSIGDTAPPLRRSTAEPHPDPKPSPGPDSGPGPGVTRVALDVARTERLRPVLAGADAVVLAVRPSAGEEHRLAAFTLGVLDEAAARGTRLLVVGGSAPLLCPDGSGRRAIEDPERVPPAWQAIARASLDQLEACREHSYRDWVYFSPPAVLEPGERTGGYRRATTTLLTDEDGASRITAPDLAIAILDELEVPGDQRHLTVAAHRA